MSRDSREVRLARKREQKRAKRKGLAARPGNAAPSRPGNPILAPVVATGAQPQRISFDVRYTNGGAGLSAVGPLLDAEWSVPAATAAALTALGQAVPPPIKGSLLIDTGAGGTCIAAHVADALTLPKVGTVKMFGAHGQQESIRYMAHLRIAVQQGGTVSAIESETIVAGIPHMQESAAQFGAKNGKGQPINLIGVLGREFLQHCHMSYNGPAGVVHIEVDVQSLRPAPIRAMAPGSSIVAPPPAARAAGPTNGIGPTPSGPAPNDQAQPPAADPGQPSVPTSTPGDSND